MVDHRPNHPGVTLNIWLRAFDIHVKRDNLQLEAFICLNTNVYKPCKQPASHIFLDPKVAGPIIKMVNTGDGHVSDGNGGSGNCATLSYEEPGIPIDNIRKRLNMARIVQQEVRRRAPMHSPDSLKQMKVD